MADNRPYSSRNSPENPFHKTISHIPISELLRGRQKASSPSNFQVIKIHPVQTTRDNGGRISPFSSTNTYQSKIKKSSKSPITNNPRSLSTSSDNKAKRTETSVIEPPKSHRATNSSISKGEQPTPEKLPSQKSMIQSYIQNCKNAESRVLKSIKSFSKEVKTQNNQAKGSKVGNLRKSQDSSIVLSKNMEKQDKEILNSARSTMSSTPQKMKKETLNEQQMFKQDPPMLVELLKERNIKIPSTSQERIANKNSEGTEKHLSNLDKNTQYSEYSELSEKSLQSQQEKIIHYSDKSMHTSQKSEKSVHYSDKCTQVSNDTSQPSEVSSRKRSDERYSERRKESEPNDFFVESWKKLLTVNAAIKTESILKGEIMQLIEIIKEEKLSIAAEFNKLFEDLRQSEDEKKKLQEKYERKIRELSILTNRNKPKSIASKTPRDNKIPPLKFDNDNLFTLDQLTDQGSPLHIHDNLEELLQNIKLLNSDVDSITKESLNTQNESFAHYMDPKDHVDEPNFTPSMLDIISSQKEMLNYLIKRLQAEEQQRLRTEIQASRMISSMEKLLQQMEEKNGYHRRSNSPTSRSIKLSSR